MYNTKNAKLEGYKVKSWGATVAGGWSTCYFLTPEGLKRCFPHLAKDAKKCLIPLNVHYNN